MFKIKITSQTKKKINKKLQSAEKAGDIRVVKRIFVLFAVESYLLYSTISKIHKVSEESIRLFVRDFLLRGLESLQYKKSSGRPSKLTKTQKKKLDKIIEDGPTKAGFPGACWRSPMIQTLIYKKFGCFYSVHYISQLLKNMGFSFQRAKFDADRKDPVKRKEWLKKKWPEILKLAKEKNAYILFGDEASFPQWGTLTYTWAKRGKQPIVITCGLRKGYKVFGLIEYFSGRFFSKTHEGRCNSESYSEFLKDILQKTKKHLILIQDGARYHTSKAMKGFFKENEKRLTVYDLPSYSPDYNPIEKLWKKIKEKETHLQYFPTFESLKKKVQSALINFQELKHEIFPLFGFYRDLDVVK